MNIKGIPIDEFQKVSEIMFHDCPFLFGMGKSENMCRKYAKGYVEDSDCLECWYFELQEYRRIKNEV